MKPKFTSIWKVRHAEHGRWFVFALIIGLTAGMVAIGFHTLTDAVQYVALKQFAGYQPTQPAGEHSIFHATEHALDLRRLWLVITMGGLVTGWLVYQFAPEAEGHGTDGAIDAFHNKRGIIPLRIPIVKALASAVTLGTGGSAGREGPIAQIGAGVGSYLASRMQLSARDRRVMLAMGMGAGIGAIFRAPMAGAIFAGEIMYRDPDIEAHVIVPGAIASTIAYAVFQLALPGELKFLPLFGELRQYGMTTVLELIPYALLALAVVAAAVFYVSTFHVSERFFRAMRIPRQLKPMIGAAAAGLVVIVAYWWSGQDVRVLSGFASGYGVLQQAMSDLSSMAIPLLLAVALVKVVATSWTIGSGGSGGVFGPSMVIGGAVGGAVGKLLNGFWPNVVTQPEALTIVGMAGFFAACANAPFSTVLMVCELTGNYKLLVPTVWVAAIAYGLGRPWSLYSSQVDSPLDSPAHNGDFTVDLLEGMLVQEVYKPRVLLSFRDDASLDEIVHSLTRTTQRYFPVYDAGRNLVGIFSADDVRLSLYDELLWKVANASDIMVERVITVTTDDDLNTALNRFTALNVDELPVIAADDPNHILGVLRRKETIAAYNRRRLELAREAELESR